MTMPDTAGEEVEDEYRAARRNVVPTIWRLHSTNRRAAHANNAIP